MRRKVFFLLLAAGEAALSGAAAQVVQFGLDTRPANPTCVAPARPTTGGSIATEDPFPASPGFTQPIKLRQAPGDATRWFVAEQTGRIKVFNTSSPGTVATYLNLTSKVNASYPESGLLGFAFHPDFPATPEVFVSYTATGTASLLESRISRIILDNTVTPVNTTEQVLLRLDQPADNHNGGNIEFGPDGYLYIGFGDGGFDGDPGGNGQNTANLFAAMLRIDVLGVTYPTPAYDIPPDNPFAGNARCGPTASNPQSCPEIFAWGLRNPWRWSFDPQTGMLWLGDVGESNWEEVDLVENGGNYGWRCREGKHSFNTSGNCPAGMIDPVAEYSHSEGVSITGGYVYRGSALSQLVGRYVFGDYGTGLIWALSNDGAGGFTRQQLASTGDYLSTFGVGLDNELYYASYNSGRMRRLKQGTGGGTDTIPVVLSATGCAAPGDATQPSPGLVPYDVNAPFWSDDAGKTRYLGLPDGKTITVNASGDWDFPTGTVIRKDFRLAGQLVETRLLMRHPDGVWAGYTYEWNGSQTDATRVIGGKTKIVNGQPWIYPSEGECLRCHTAAAGYALGPETRQLNRDFYYASTGRTANQVATLNHIGMFSAPLTGTPTTWPRLPDPADTAEPPQARARAYLDTNCSQCHRPAGPTPVNLDLRYATALQNMNACNVVPTAGDLGIAGARRIAPGADALSVVTARALRRDATGMPPLGSSLADTAGVAVVSAWINGLGSCQDSDNDQVDDARDNCVNVANPGQFDGDGDGYGNRCDGDFSNNGVTNAQDYTIFRTLLGSGGPAADLSENGVVNAQDYIIFRSLLGSAPGPSALQP